MTIEAATKQMLDLLLMESKEYRAMDKVLRARFEMVLNLLLAVEGVDDLKVFGRLNLKEYNGFYQIYVDGDKRIWFTLTGDGILVADYGVGNH